jgi:hypothetical protein
MSMSRLSCDQKNHVLRRVYHRLREIEPGLFQAGEPWRPGGAYELCDHIERLIEGALIWAPQHQARAREHICSNCYHRTPCGYCPARAGCVFDRHAPLIMDVAAQAVRELGLRKRAEDGGHNAGNEKRE